jgi:hypothetical protein
MVIFAATIGAKALYLLFLWLLSAGGAAWLADRKGYTERLGLTFGLVLSVVGLAIMLLLPGRPGSAWKQDGPLPRRGRRQAGDTAAPGPPAVAGDTSAPGPPPVAGDTSAPEPPPVAGGDPSA